MKSDWTKARRLRVGGILLMVSGGVWFLAAVLSRQPAFSGMGAAFFCIGISFISKSKKSATH